MADRHLILAGGGHAHVEVLRRLVLQPMAGWRVTLLTREEHSPYSGMWKDWLDHGFMRRYQRA